MFPILFKMTENKINWNVPIFVTLENISKKYSLNIV